MPPRLSQKRLSEADLLKTFGAVITSCVAQKAERSPHADISSSIADGTKHPEMATPGGAVHAKIAISIPPSFPSARGFSSTPRLKRFYSAHLPDTGCDTSITPRLEIPTLNYGVG